MACLGLMPWMHVLERISVKHPDYLATSNVRYLTSLTSTIIHLDSRRVPIVYLTLVIRVDN